MVERHHHQTHRIGVLRTHPPGRVDVDDQLRRIFLVELPSALDVITVHEFAIGDPCPQRSDGCESLSIAEMVGTPMAAFPSSRIRDIARYRLIQTELDESEVPLRRDS